MHGSLVSNNGNVQPHNEYTVAKEHAVKLKSTVNLPADRSISPLER